MRDISLHILDIAENAVRANASLICIDIKLDKKKDLLTLRIEDNGCGMSKEMLRSVKDPFTTSRTTRHVGFGIPLMTASCEKTGKTLDITSDPGKGTRLTATYRYSHIDRPPIGDVAQTVYTLTLLNPQIDFVLTAQAEASFTFDTRQVKQTLGEVPINTPEVLTFLDGYLHEGMKQVFEGSQI